MITKSDRPRVLLVDDYPYAREMYTEYLEFSGFDVVEAGNGMEALQRALAERHRIPQMAPVDARIGIDHLGARDLGLRRGHRRDGGREQHGRGDDQTGYRVREPLQAIW